MTYCIVLFVLFNLFGGIITAKQNSAFTQKNIPYEPGTVVVKLKEETTRFQKVDATAAITALQLKYSVISSQKFFEHYSFKKSIGSEELERIYIFHVPVAADIEKLCRSLAAEPNVEYAEPHYYLPLNTVPNDILFSQIYQLGIVKADTAWSIQKGDSTVIIGIIDTGVDWDHPDLAPVIWRNYNEIAGNGIDDDGNGYIDDIRGWDFVANVSDAYVGEDSTMEDNNPMDFNGHGTHVAGIAAGATNNTIGIASLGWGCKIMPLRCGWHGKEGKGFVSSLYAAKAYVYAANNGASVCNQSSETSEVVRDGAKYAYNNGVVIVNSAGNTNSDFIGILGAESWALSVASTNSNDIKANYSSYNSRIDISAPGGDFNSGNAKGFLSTIVHPSPFYNNQEYVEMQGTSMASPLVAALAGLVKVKNKLWSPAQIMFQITGTADNIDELNPSFAGKLGYGRINALRALTETPAPPKPNIQFVRYVIDDATTGNGNGLMDAGEDIRINIIVRNDWGDAHNLIAELSAINADITITKSISNYGLLKGISMIDSSQRGNLNDDFAITISTNAIPQIVTFTISFSADGGYTKQINVDIPLSPQVLLVDDDDGIVNVESYYKEALRTLKVGYEVWDHSLQKTPPLSLLQNYKAVIWLCEWAFPALDSADREVLIGYLNNGGKLFLSGQDIGWDLADPNGTEFIASSGSSKIFYENYLKAKYISDDAVNSTLNGSADNPIGNGITINRFQPMRDPAYQFPDVVDPINGSTSIFNFTGGSYNGKSGAILYSGLYKLVHFTFGGFESITDSITRLIVINRVLDWLDNTISKADIKDSGETPLLFQLSQNYPNPFNPTTTIAFSIPFKSHIKLTIYDVLGRNVETLVNEERQPGNYQVQFNASRIASGIYFYKLSANGFSDVKKMLLLR